MSFAKSKPTSNAFASASTAPIGAVIFLQHNAASTLPLSSLITTPNPTVFCAEDSTINIYFEPASSCRRLRHNMLCHWQDKANRFHSCPVLHEIICCPPDQVLPKFPLFTMPYLVLVVP